MPVVADLPNAALLSLANSLAWVVQSLCQVLSKHVLRDRSQVSLIFLASQRVRRIAERFATLAAAEPMFRQPYSLDQELWQRRTQPARTGPSRPPLPRNFGWLANLVPDAAGFGKYLRMLMAEPEVAALMTRSPEAAKLLKSLCHMVGTACLPMPLALRPPTCATVEPGSAMGSATGPAPGGASAPASDLPASDLGPPPSAGLRAAASDSGLAETAVVGPAAALAAAPRTDAAPFDYSPGRHPSPFDSPRPGGGTLAPPGPTRSTRR